MRFIEHRSAYDQLPDTCSNVVLTSNNCSWPDEWPFRWINSGSLTLSGSYDLSRGSPNWFKFLSKKKRQILMSIFAHLLNSVLIKQLLNKNLYCFIFYLHWNTRDRKALLPLKHAGSPHHRRLLKPQWHQHEDCKNKVLVVGDWTLQ